MQKIFKLASIFIIPLAVGGCSLLFNKNPWDGKLYVGDHKALQVVRNQDDEKIMCSDASFDHMICMTSDDFDTMIRSYRYLRVTCEPNQDNK